MKNNDDTKNWDFDPSSDEEFMKTIEQVLLEEEQEQQQKININRTSDIQWIDISEEKQETPQPEDGEDNVDTIENAVTKESDNLLDEEPVVTSETSEQTVVDSPEEEPEFVEIEKAVHNMSNMDELYEEHSEIVEENHEEDSIVKEITDSLSKQVDSTLQTNQVVSSVKKKKRMWMRILIPLASVATALLLLLVFFLYTDTGRDILLKLGSSYASSQMDYNDGSNQEEVYVPDITDAPEDLVNLPELNTEDINLNADEGIARHEDYAVNILLLGEEAIDSGMARGRTDVMMIATLNTKQKSLKITSLMRDMYVQIPGHLDNKLNSAYATGGIPLLYETIELNFNIKLDGYCLVGFNNFEKIIDLMDGIDIELTSTEANYLNTTNYISNPEYRKVTAGWNHMNGNQALGYCRIRKVGTAGKEYNDFGRTSRSRVVLDSIFNKYKSLGLWDLAIIVNSCLPMITTDLDSAEIENYLSMALDIGLNKLEQSRIPADGTFEDATVRKMSVIVPNLQKNVEILHTFIFGEAN